jgi:hypothetical protein
MPNEVSTIQSKEKNWRLTLGTWMFYAPFVMFFGAPVAVPLFGFSASESAALVGGILVVAEVIWFASIPLLGKEGFKQMKSQAFSLLKPKSGPIRKSRHLTGVWMFIVGLLSQIILGASVMIAFFFVGAKDTSILILGLSFEEQAIAYVTIQFAGIALMVTSVYVLGSDFWDKLIHAFEWQEGESEMGYSANEQCLNGCR